MTEKCNCLACQLKEKIIEIIGADGELQQMVNIQELAQTNIDSRAEAADAKFTFDLFACFDKTDRLPDHEPKECETIGHRMLYEMLEAVENDKDGGMYQVATILDQYKEYLVRGEVDVNTCEVVGDLVADLCMCERCSTRKAMRGALANGATPTQFVAIARKLYDKGLIPVGLPEGEEGLTAGMSMALESMTPLSLTKDNRYLSLIFEMKPYQKFNIDEMPKGVQRGRASDLKALKDCACDACLWHHDFLMTIEQGELTLRQVVERALEGQAAGHFDDEHQHRWKPFNDLVTQAQEKGLIPKRESETT